MKIYQLIVASPSYIIEDVKADSKEELEQYKNNAVESLKDIYKNIKVTKHNVRNVEMYLIKVS